MLLNDPCVPDCCGVNTAIFPDSPPADRPGGPYVNYVKPMVRMAGMAQDIPDYAVIGWKWLQPLPINYDVKTKTLHMGCNFIRVPQLIRTTMNFANRGPRSDEAKDYVFHTDTSCEPATLYTSDGTQWYKIGGSVC